MNMKKGYMIYPHWWETIKKLPREDKGELMEVMMEYINNETVIDMSFTVELVFTPIKQEIDEQNQSDTDVYVYKIKFFNDDETFLKIGISYDVERRAKEISSAGYKYIILEKQKFLTREDALEFENYLHRKYANYKYLPHKMFSGFTECFSINVLKEKDKDNVKDSNILVSKDIELTLKPITLDINNLIQELKEQADILGIAYDKNKERMFAKHIMNTKEYGSFCEKVGMTRVEFAKNIMKASERIGYWKGTCSGPMSIYQNYSDVYNQTKTKSESSKPKEATGYESVAIITDEI